MPHRTKKRHRGPQARNWNTAHNHWTESRPGWHRGQASPIPVCHPCHSYPSIPTSSIRSACGANISSMAKMLRSYVICKTHLCLVMMGIRGIFRIPTSSNLAIPLALHSIFSSVPDVNVSTFPCRCCPSCVPRNPRLRMTPARHTISPPYHQSNGANLTLLPDWKAR
ncbi:hypothetical protein K458DRAFT_55625 [Lentithecium fluviatile CBS 122367]|uniref:Uncharacterized protein n=1 Tax=Lentithecium fluviatile CBS 122367 TaxID=1168545 RepID=A0A6G1IX14_9PLEO|nr:hypothetical protein K458DRAFT_55625 [Lentithecium fluviatile CBS 122367]